MNKKLNVSLIVFMLFLINFVMVGVYEGNSVANESKTLGILNHNGEYSVQWQHNYGPDWQGGRYEGPQPIGDCDNDGKNELLIGGRDSTLTVMEWDEEKQIYREDALLHSPFYPLFLIRQRLTGETPPSPGGFAIGDVTGDGENEIVATWYGAVYKYIAGSYRIIG